MTWTKGRKNKRLTVISTRWFHLTLVKLFSSVVRLFFAVRRMNDIGFGNGNFPFPLSKHLSHNIWSFSQIYVKALSSQFPWRWRDLIFLWFFWMRNLFVGIHSRNHTTQFHEMISSVHFFFFFPLSDQVKRFNSCHSYSYTIANWKRI